MSYADDYLDDLEDDGWDDDDLPPIGAYVDEDGDDPVDTGPFYYGTPDDSDIHDPDDDYDDDADSWNDIIYDDPWLDCPYQWQHRY